MAPKWPQVNNGPEHINEHATYLREACHQLQAVDKGRQNQIPWNIVQKYLESTIALAGKVLQQPALSEILHHAQDAAKCTQIIQKDVSIIKNSWRQSSHNLGTGGRQRPHATSAGPQQHAYHQDPTHCHGIQRPSDNSQTQRPWNRPTLPGALRGQDKTASRDIHPKPHGHQVGGGVAAHQLKSGDIQVFTSSTAGAAKLKENRQWVSSLGEHAEVIVPTYGVIAHGISTSTINVKDQKATIQQILADNYTVIPKADISFVGWLTRESPNKRASSIVVEFTDPEMANAIIYAGMVWDGQIHTCQLYDRACRVKQCFRCYNYGHISTQCDAAQACGYCAELHETKTCPQKGAASFTPRCTVCKGAHTAWSNSCPARKKEMGRIEQAKQVRNTYWPMVPKAKPLDKSPENNNPRKRARQAREPTPDKIITIESPREEYPDHEAITQEPAQAPGRSSLQELQTPQDTTPVQALNHMAYWALWLRSHWILPWVHRSSIV
ncbi:hypothetical protein CISG_01911 [Coccidioides immitis RMSCC 3703]|uniref:CCHC-type domain-containing protein n=1 Tax=Coccidioides immitis RMSCC 3703 TaxID=454286 RepID=A0A0J8R6W9_COCIT|nr:hypothetical protein CISG_01911 [Coccidioides immitis RMSCC 3703]